MASSSGKDMEIGGDDDRQQRNTTSLDSTGASSECGDRGCEKQEPRVSDEVHTAQDCWSSLYQSVIGLCCSGAPFSNPKRTASPSPSCSSWTYHSARIQDMMEKRGKFSTEMESEIEASKAAWSEIDGRVSEAEQSGKTNREYFRILRGGEYVRKGDQLVVEQISADNIHANLFREKWGAAHLVVGEKLAEGGQAEIYAADYMGPHFVVKVFKGGSVLPHLEKQFPPALLKWHQRGSWGQDSRESLPGALWGATLLPDERWGGEDRFAFVMFREWGDLRKLIDERMVHYSLNQGPPFSPKQLLHLIEQIAIQMNILHRQRPPILHNGLKAENVLVFGTSRGPRLDRNGMYEVHVADYECSVGVLCTGLWRAPEILQNLKDRVDDSPLNFKDKCDVYSFGMTCYEIVTGRIPFEDHSFIEGRDLVLKGERPHLPPDLDPLVKEIITSCWDTIPSKRPSFEDIVESLKRF